MPSWSPINKGADGKPIDRLQRAACKLVLQHGFDQVSVSAIIKESEVSRRTFYSYYENVAAVLADVWIGHGVAFLQRLIAGAEASEDNSDRLLSYILAISHRVEEVHEVVTEDIERSWAELATDPLEQLRWAWLVAVSIGHRIQTEAQVAPSGPEIFRLLTMLREANLIALQDGISVVPPIYPPLVVLDDDPTTQRVLNAAVDVVGKSGAVKTNVLRICRRAKVSAGAVSGRFTSPDKVVTAAFQRLLALVVEQNMRRYEQFEGVQLDTRYAASVAAALEPSRSKWRKFRREIVVASCHDERVRRQAVESLKWSDIPQRRYLEDTKLGVSAQDAAVEFNRELSEGMAILLDLGLPLNKLNHLPTTRVALHWLASIG